MRIQELARRTWVSATTTRYYESIGLLPQPERQANGYREYGDTDTKRVRLVAGARNLDLSLDDIREILALRDRREAPYRVLLDQLERKAAEIRHRIVQLQRREKELRQPACAGPDLSSG